MGPNHRHMYIDGYDEISQQCYSGGPYSRNGINRMQRKDLWNAELIVDNYNPEIIPGKQICARYGPHYWCSDDHSAEHMCMAVIK